MSRTLFLTFLVVLTAGSMADELLAPSSLNSAFTLSYGRLWLTDEDYSEFFGEDFLPSWTFRYDHKIWRGVQIGAGFSASGKSHFTEDISLGGDEYPVRYAYSSFQFLWEIGLRVRLPQIRKLAFFSSLSVVQSNR